VRRQFRRWGVFNLVAAGGFVIQIGTIALLTRAFGWTPFAATTLGLELAALHNFVGHSAWTFDDYPVGSAGACLARYWRYQMAHVASLGANLAITLVLMRVSSLQPEVSNVLAIVLCALPNYLLVRRSFVGNTFDF
jgi:putative flippase GtrA